MIYAVVLTLVVVALLAVSLGRFRRLRSQDDFMVANRGLSAGVLIFTCCVHGSARAACLEARNSHSIAAWRPCGFRPAGWAGLLVVYFIAGRARAFAQYTVPDLLEAHYGPWARVFGTVCIIVSYTAIVSYQFRGGGRILNLAFGINEGWAFHPGCLRDSIYGVGRHVLGSLHRPGDWSFGDGGRPLRPPRYAGSCGRLETVRAAFAA